MVKRPTIATVAVALLLTGCGLFDRDVATTTSLPSSPTSTSTAQLSTAPTEATTSTTSSSTTTSVAPTSSSTTADPPEPAGVEVFLGVLRPTSGGLWAVPVGVSNVALPTPESFPRIRRVEPDEVGGLVVETTRGKVYHFPSGGRAPRELVLPGTWFGMGTLGGEPVVLVEAVDWLDADFVYDCEGDPCLPGFDYVVGTGRQIFSAVSLADREPVELVRHVGTWELSGVPADVIETVSVSTDRLLVQRYVTISDDCGAAPLPACEQSWLEFRALSGALIDEPANPAPPSAPFGWLFGGTHPRLSADGRILIYRSPNPDDAVVALDLDSGNELARLVVASRDGRESSLTAWWYNNGDTLLTVRDHERGTPSTVTAELTVLTDDGSLTVPLELSEAFVSHLESSGIHCCSAVSYATTLDIDWRALSELSLPPAGAQQRLTLRADGLGPARFGDGADAAMADLTAILGHPAFDHEYAGPWPDETGCASTGYGCDTYLRLVEWEYPELRVVFTDGSAKSEPAPPHFVGWSHSGGLELVTPAGVAVDLSIDDLRALLGDALELPSQPDPDTGQWSLSVDGVAALLDGDPRDSTTKVVRLEAGEAFPSI